MIPTKDLVISFCFSSPAEYPLKNPHCHNASSHLVIFVYILFVLSSPKQIKLEVELRTFFCTETQLHSTYCRQPGTLHSTFKGNLGCLCHNLRAFA